MFKLTPVDAKDNGIDMDQTEKMDNDAQGMKLQSLLIFLFVLAIPFVSVYAQEQEGACANRPCELTDMPGGQGGSTHVMCETIEGIAGANRENRPLFMRDDWYMEGGFDVDTIGEVKKNDGNDTFKYREWILNNSYNIVKGKVLSAQIGKDNNGTIADLTQMRFNTVKASVFNLKKVIENEKAFNKIRNIQLKHDIAKGMMWDIKEIANGKKRLFTIDWFGIGKLQRRKGKRGCNKEKLGWDGWIWD